MRPTRRPLVICGVCFFAAMLTFMLKPTDFLADHLQPIDLDSMVPERFQGWSAIPRASTQIIDPGQLAMINRLYTQTLSRGYVNRDGYIVMLSIAYGKDQRDALQLHKPEVCYPAQGFTLLNKATDVIDVDMSPPKKIQVTHLQTIAGVRTEPVTYWTVVGDIPYVSGIDKKLAEMQYGLTGKIPDGMLVRMSSIDADAENAFKIQGQFAVAMLAAIKPDVRSRFSGNRTVY
ncbi:MAG TPA: EpsI family protein [Rhodocyclaceae bacterium]|nr:EpsI family protein [Rhodocyclaceae bacterium]